LAFSSFFWPFGAASFTDGSGSFFLLTGKAKKNIIASRRFSTTFSKHCHEGNDNLQERRMLK
jgi:hypothetical protein